MSRSSGDIFPAAVVGPVDVITVEDDGTDNSTRRYHRVERRTTIDVTCLDGEGIISTRYARRIDKAFCGQKRGAGFLKSCSPFSAAKCHGKNPDAQGDKGGDFFAPCAKKYDPTLDGLDRRNGAKCGLLFDNEYGIIFASTD